MQVTVKLFATLRRFAPDGLAGAPLKVDLPEEATLLDLINRLGIPPEETRITFVNGIIQEVDCKLKDSDEVGIFPPVGGG